MFILVRGRCGTLRHLSLRPIVVGCVSLRNWSSTIRRTGILGFWTRDNRGHCAGIIMYGATGMIGWGRYGSFSRIRSKAIGRGIRWRGSIIGIDFSPINRISTTTIRKSCGPFSKCFDSGWIWGSTGFDSMRFRIYACVKERIAKTCRKPTR